jgi:hypothetical protein
MGQVTAIHEIRDTMDVRESRVLETLRALP